ncbi:aspartate dehydrogenase [Thalassospiraceae bacterium LMO-JJ14]|nr:aspartate dehydrogenase [Thalassospiraceae bacterium LMO-JJ14]
MTSKSNLKVAVAGLGAVCLPVARWLANGVEGFDLVAVSANDKEGAAKKIADFKYKPPIVDLDELVSMGDIIVEGLPPARYFDLAEPVIEQGKTLVAVTVTQLLERPDLIERAKQTGARIIVPTGALMAFDAVRAASYGTINSLVMATRKPPKGLLKAPFVIEQGIDLSDLKEPLCLYSGSVRDAAQKFPANVNVAVALSLAGSGPDETSYEIWADPAVDRNTHTVKLDSDATRFEFTIAGVPTDENPATGKLTPLSVMATLEGMVSTLKIGA